MHGPKPRGPRPSQPKPTLHNPFVIPHLRLHGVRCLTLFSRRHGRHALPHDLAVPCQHLVVLGRCFGQGTVRVSATWGVGQCIVRLAPTPRHPRDSRHDTSVGCHGHTNTTLTSSTMLATTSALSA